VYKYAVVSILKFFYHNLTFVKVLDKSHTYTHLSWVYQRYWYW